VNHTRELVIGQPAVLAVQMLTVILFAIATVGFLRRGAGAGEELMRTLALATTVGVFAAFNYFLFPSLYSEWVYSGDILRCAFYLTIFAAVVRELNGYWRGLARAAALEERRRIARDLHDGLAQELAFITSQSKLLGPGLIEEQLASAADRALEESRRAIDALTRPLDEPLEVSVRRTAEEIAIRFGTELTLRLQEGMAAAPGVRDTLRRITREAMINAARHGRARHIVVSLEESGSRIRLRIEDDGAGFDPSRPTRGFGLVSMRERAEMHQADFFLRSDSGGTSVEVVLP
jgi:signal transduction histidine kinase